jgi:hypothetical protein
MRHVLGTVAQDAGRQSGFVRRERKLTGASFCQALVFGWLANPEATVEERAQAAATCGTPISPYGLEKRLDDERASKCLLRVLEKAMGEVVKAASPATIPVLERFSGVYLYDGSVVGLPDALREAYPGCGGSYGPEAALKVGVRLELLCGELHATLGAAREHDRNLALEAERMPVGALRLADLGFFELKLFSSLSQRGCYWLSRLMARVALYEEEGLRRLDLAELLLGALPQQQRMEFSVKVGEKEKLAARLLAARVPEEVANERRRRVRKEAIKRGQAVSEERLRLAGWTILITDAPPELLTIEEALVVMRARWQIEKLFDLWKRYGHLDKSRSKKPWRMLCEVYAKLIGLIIGHWVILAGSWRKAERSLVKAARTVRQRSLSLAEELDNPKRLRRTLESIARCLQAGCRVDKRRKQPGTAQQLLALTDAGKEVAIA